MILFTHGEEYVKKMKAEGDNVDVVPFEEFIKKTMYSRDKYALGPKSKRVDFSVCKIENTENANTEKMKKMVSDFLEKIDIIFERNEYALYNNECLPKEKLVLPKFHKLKEASQGMVQFYNRNNGKIWAGIGSFAGYVLHSVMPVMIRRFTERNF